MKNSRNSPILEFFLFINQLSEFPSLRTIKFSCGEKRKEGVSKLAHPLFEFYFQQSRA